MFIWTADKLDQVPNLSTIWACVSRFLVSEGCSISLIDPMPWGKLHPTSFPRKAKLNDLKDIEHRCREAVGLVVLPSHSLPADHYDGSLYFAHQGTRKGSFPPTWESWIGKPDSFADWYSSSLAYAVGHRKGKEPFEERFSLACRNYIGLPSVALCYESGNLGLIGDWYTWCDDTGTYWTSRPSSERYIAANRLGIVMKLPAKPKLDQGKRPRAQRKRRKRRSADHGKSQTKDHQEEGGGGTEAQQEEQREGD